MKLVLERSFGSQWGSDRALPPEGGVPWEVSQRALVASGLGMNALKRLGQTLGLTEVETQKALRLDRPANDAAWVVAEDLGSEALAIALSTFESGRHLEYDCYDNAGANQGRGLQRMLR